MQFSTIYRCQLPISVRNKPAGACETGLLDAKIKCEPSFVLRSSDGDEDLPQNTQLSIPVIYYKRHQDKLIHALGAGLTRATFLKPQVELKNAKISSIWGGKLDVDLSLYNPNLFEVDATRLSYTITKLSDGDLIAEGVLNEHFNVPARGTIDIILPAVVSWHGMEAAGASLVNRGATDFLISGEMVIESGVAGKVTNFLTTCRDSSLWRKENQRDVRDGESPL